jgi:hypothetical protein
MLRNKLDNELEPMWAKGDVTVKDLWEAFAKYVYLPRLRDIDVLRSSIAQGPAMISWENEGFAVAIGVDEREGKYLGLTAGSHPGEVAPLSRVVKPEFALGQLEIETQREPDGETGLGDSGGLPGLRPPTWFRGRVTVDPDRPNKAFTTITQEVLDHLVGLVNTEVVVTVHVVANRVEGFPDNVIRTVTENARTLKFEEGSGFDEV